MGKLPPPDITWCLATCALICAILFQQGQLEEVQAQRDDAERRMGQCIDIAGDAREFALLSEEAWLNAAEEASYCQMAEGWMYNICPGSEYWTSYGWGGP